jgi:Flp pilus assembly protein TadG
VCNVICRLGREAAGNVGIMFALAAVPVLGTAGMAVDYLPASNFRSELQTAVDGAALAAAAQVNNGQIGNTVDAFMAANAAKNPGSPKVSTHARSTPTR